jgi:hypothetical protein
MKEGPVRLLDVVELRVASGRWPVGTVGTVVEDFDASVLVEISDEMGRGLDFLELPPDAVAPITQPEQERLPVP